MRVGDDLAADPGPPSPAARDLSPVWDEEREDYASLADEMNDYGVPPWNEADWDELAVANARRYAAKHGLRFPPQTGDYDRFYEEQRG